MFDSWRLGLDNFTKIGGPCDHLLVGGWWCFESSHGWILSSQKMDATNLKLVTKASSK